LLSVIIVTKADVYYKRFTFTPVLAVKLVATEGIGVGLTSPNWTWDGTVTATLKVETAALDEG
jgi:hypothetical protein